MRPASLLLLTITILGCVDTAPPAKQRSPSDNGVVASAPDADGFVPLPADSFKLFAPATEKGEIALVDFDNGFQLTGTKRAYAHTRDSYRDFTIRFDFRWPNAAKLPEEERQNANTGLLVFITDEHKIWPKCLEVQGKWTELGHIKSNARDVSVNVQDDEAARQQARKPVGEWNSVEVVAKDGALTSYLNGIKIAESEPTELREGPIAFQAERFDVEFRNVRIREE